LQPGTPPPDATPMTTPSGETVLAASPPPSGPFKVLWFHEVQIEIGIGPDPSVATAILDSIGFIPGTPDTPAAGVCERSANPDAMPTPERLAQPLMLDQGGVTLDPPAPTDQAIMTASQAWSQGGPKSPFQKHRLLLTRYSARLPARVNSNGSLTPENQNELAWVIYSVPFSMIAGCAGWSLDMFDARTGQAQISSGYTPGP
ncbi:MAG: hypothetical protein ACRDOE_25825, partial [Streptosporangiaceae bacterium]